MNRSRTVIATAILLLVLLVAPFGFAEDDEDIIDATEWTDEIIEIEVTSSGFRFTPREIRVALGSTVQITYVNGGGRHDWVLDEFDAATAVIGARQSETIEFVADEAGEFEFYCSVGGHRAAGMYGAFIVVDMDA